MRAHSGLATLLVLAATVTGCSLTGSDEPAASDPSGAAAQSVTLITHDSFALSDGVLATFTEQTGITVELRSGGDAGALTNQLVLTKDAPVADVAYGVDNTFASRALDAGVFAPYTSPAASDGAAEYAVTGSDALTPIDYSDVCLNVDTRYFDGKQLAVPSTLDDLTKPEYEGLTVVENPATSSPGLAFLLATVAKYGQDDWQPFWRQLRANDVLVADGWEQAYTVDFSGSSGQGPRPIVVSYASSPPAESTDGAPPPTKALLGTCFRQIEYAGVLTGAKNPDAAHELIDFLLSPTVQRDVPGQMYVYPVQDGTPLPADWKSYAPVPPDPLTLDPATISANREAWTQQWRSIVQG